MDRFSKQSQAAIKGLRVLRELKESPFGLVSDLFLSSAISIVVPLPFAQVVVTKYKKLILFGIISSTVCGIGLFATVFLIVTSPFLVMNTITPITPSAIASLQGYIEEGFVDTDIPMKNPFGGSGMDKTITTVSFHEVEHIIWNTKPITETEEGIDLVPNNLYFLTTKAAKLAGQPIVFSTLTGNAYSYSDQNGALIVEVINGNKTMKTLFIHLQQILVADNSFVHAGQPIGVMGSTGMSTGPHLEYQVRINNGGTWSLVNPINYIK